MIQLIAIDPAIEYPSNLATNEGFEQLMTIYRDYYPQVGFQLPWIGYFIVQNDILVGSCGFTGKPVAGMVEIAYWTFTGYEGKGIASEASAELIRLARAKDPHITIRAKTAPEQNSSTRILEKQGFIFTGIVQDHEIGDAWEWQLPPAK